MVPMGAGVTSQDDCVPHLLHLKPTHHTSMLCQLHYIEICKTSTSTLCAVSCIARRPIPSIETAFLLQFLLFSSDRSSYSNSVLLYIQQRPLFEILSIYANMYIIIDSVYEILSAL